MGWISGCLPGAPFWQRHFGSKACQLVLEKVCLASALCHLGLSITLVQVPMAFWKLIVKDGHNIYKFNLSSQLLNSSYVIGYLNFKGPTCCLQGGCTSGGLAYVVVWVENVDVYQWFVLLSSLPATFCPKGGQWVLDVYRPCTEFDCDSYMGFLGNFQAWVGLDVVLVGIHGVCVGFL